MGYSWVASGEVRLARKSHDAYRKTEIDPAQFDDWPDSWGEPGCDQGPMTVADVLHVYETYKPSEITWTDDGVRLRALFSNDSDLWLTYRSHFAAALRAVAQLGGSADVAITGWLDGGPSDVFHIVASPDGKSDVGVLTSKRAKPVSDRVHADVRPLVDAMLARLARPKTQPTGGDLMRVHASVCAALRSFPEAKLMKLATAEKRVFAHPSGWGSLKKLFPTAPLLVDGLEQGWEEKGFARTADRLPVIALHMLGQLDPARAKELGKEYLAIKGRRTDKRLMAIHAEARALKPALGSKAATAKGIGSALSALRKAVPNRPTVSIHHTLEDASAIRALRDSKAPGVKDALRTELLKVTKRLRVADHAYAYALSVALEPHVEGKELEMLFRLWTDSPGYLLLDQARILKHGATGKAYLAALFGRKTRSHYASNEQAMAAKALLETDEKAALSAARTIVKRKTFDEVTGWALREMVQEMWRRRPADKAWMALFEEIVRKHPTADAASEAIQGLVKWKHPKAAPLALGLVGKAYAIEGACELIDQTKDRTVLPALRKLVATLGKTERRERDRLEQTIDALS